MDPVQDAASDPNARLVVEWFRRYAARESMAGLVDEHLVAHGSPTFMYPVDAQDADARVQAMHESGLDLELLEILGTDRHGRVAYTGLWGRPDGSGGSFHAVGRMQDGRIVAVTYVDRREVALAELRR